ncbi:hypothetical protein N431DRAFT_421647 [Stipitochalara longipes BDJ]|nr:hypothetical protein N431DRAFT_421647 [Stipitochalara longipes BDJ]
MSPTPENWTNPPDGLPRYAQHEIASSSPGGVVYAAPPAESPNLASKARKAGVDALEGLRALPEVRSIPWQSGKELPADKSTESPRSQTRGAFLLSTRGQIRNPPCTHCATGVGRFSVCVSLDGWFHGACATCQMGTRGNLCSLRKNAEVDGVTPNKWVEPSTTQSSPLADADRPSSSLKRKRDSPSTIAAAAQSPATSYQQIQTTLPASPNPITPYHLPPNNLSTHNHPTNNPSHSGASALLNHVYQKQYPPNGTKRHQILYQTQSDPREPGTGPAPPPMNTYRMVGTGQTSKTEMVRDGSNSLSPSTQLIQPTQPPSYNTPYRNTSMAQPEARNVSHPATPLIDTLPRKKQKQIYQIIGGVQSGLRLVRQQTENMQKQLDLLQAALGIDDDDENDVSVI